MTLRAASSARARRQSLNWFKAAAGGRAGSAKKANHVNVRNRQGAQAVSMAPTPEIRRHAATAPCGALARPSMDGSPRFIPTGPLRTWRLAPDAHC